MAFCRRRQFGGTAPFLVPKGHISVITSQKTLIFSPSPGIDFKGMKDLTFDEIPYLFEKRKR